MIRLRNILLKYIPAALLLVTSCTPQESPVSPDLVVEGWVEPGIPPVVMLHQAVRPGDDVSDLEALMKKKVVIWGKVTLSDGENSVVMTGKRDTSLVPPYKYTTSEILPQSGKEYSIKVEYDGVEATSHTSLLDVVPIDSVYVEAVGGGCSTVEIFWTDPSDTDDWYCIFFRPHGRRQWISAGLGAMDDMAAREDGMMSSLVIPRGSIKYDNLGSAGLSPLAFKGGIELDVRLCHIDRVAYLFWKSFSDNAGNNFFSNIETSISSNISGGLGYFTGLASSVVTVAL